MFGLFMSSWLSFIFGNKKTVNRREDFRYPVRLNVRLNSESVSNARGEMTNLSLNGCYVKMFIAVERGEKMQINISLPTGKVFTVEGIVTFCDRHTGFGTEFNLTESQKEFMQNVIDFACEDAADIS